MAKSTHGTLTANAVTTVTITPGEEGLVVVNRSLQGEIWVRLDSVDPAIGADGSYVVIGAREFPLSRADVRKGATVVKLISDDARMFSAEAIQ